MNEEDAQQPNKQGQCYHTKSEKRVNSIENGSDIEYHQQYQTILNLFISFWNSNLYYGTSIGYE
jgi:hypothetical protein